MTKSEVTKIKKQLRALYLNATPEEKVDGVTWYARAFDFCQKIAEETGASVDYAVRACAILSAQTPWDKNMAFTALLLQGGPKPNMVPASRWASAVNGKLPETSKVSNFYLSIASEGKAGICCDSHIFRACYNGNTPVPVDKYFRSKKLYGEIAKIMIAVAKEFGITPAEFQAVIWTTWRNKNAYKKKFA